MFLSTKNIFDYIFTVFTNLIHLTFYESSYKNRLSLSFFEPPLPTFRSSTLLKLNIRIQRFDDCLYLLDGRFNQLHTLYVDLTHIYPPHDIQNQVSFIKKTCMLSNNKKKICFREIYQILSVFICLVMMKYIITMN
jgi:hypothetical protein